MTNDNLSKEEIILTNGIRRSEFWLNYKKKKNISGENNVYVMDFNVLHRIELSDNYEENQHLSIAGRITKKRTIGAVSFLKIMDFSKEIQLILKEENLWDYKNIIDNLFYGDLVAVEGLIGFSKTGERSVIVKNITMISCNYRSVPDKWHGMVDVDFCYRNPYMFFIYDDQFRKKISMRWKIMALIRKFFISHDFIEVETPVLQNVPSGAAAKPFKTHHNALDMDMYLRIAPELYLKMMIAAGYTRIFEMGKIFRNEGIDPTHLQEFTMLECYTAYVNYDFYIKFTEDLFTYLKKALELPDIIKFKGYDINLTGPWPVENFSQLIYKKLSINIDNNNNLKEDIKKYFISINENFEPLNHLNSSMGLVDYIYKKFIRPYIIQPTFIYNYPSYMAPLASVLNGKSTKIQLVVAGIEITNCYGELVDPFKQEENFKTQDGQQNNSDDDEDIFRRDNNFLSAMKFGMVPMAGFGMGIDRLISLLSEEDNLKNTLMFPSVKLI